MSENIKKVESVEQPKAKTTTKGKGKKAPASEQKAKATQEQLKKALESVGVKVENEQVEKVESKTKPQSERLKELREKLENKTIEPNEMIELANHFIRLITWKKLKDMNYISQNYDIVKPKIVKHFTKKGFDDAIKDIKQREPYNEQEKKELESKGLLLENGKVIDLHKAFNLKAIYAFYNLDFTKEQTKIRKANKVKI
jgi:hypothetical protein